MNKIEYFGFSSFISLLFSVFIIFMPSIGLAQSLGFGQANNKPINIEANEGIEWQRNEKVYIARGDAHASQGDVTVRADELMAHYRPNKTGTDEIYKIYASGSVKISSKTELATSEKAIYDLIAGVLIMTGGPVSLITPEDKIIAHDSLEYYEGKQLAIARGKAMAVRGERRVRADILRAYFGAENKKRNSSKIERIEADGNVHLSTESEIVTADRGDYRINDGLAEVSGEVKITRGKTQLNGDRAEVNLNTGRSRLLTSKPGSKNPNKRVRGIIMPSALKTKK
tara:strand:- start:8612 stop:9463 length:852 start_codon:yes stop_codon:yes gene_type:complete